MDQINSKNYNEGDFNRDALRNTYYKLFYKTYTFWKLSCQQQGYSTEFAASMIDKMEEIDSNLETIVILAIIILAI